MRPKTLVLRTAGTNCDGETAHAFEKAGALAERVHLNRVLENPRLLADYQLLAVPGGFSYGDDIAAGRIFANQLMRHLRDAFRQFIADGKPVIGVCNGFQVLVKTDLLPGAAAGRGGQTATLAHNDCGRFIDRWVHLAARSRKCVWTQGLDRIELPIAHGEGKFVPADDGVRRALWDNDQVALVYTRPDGSSAAGKQPDNPNGSIDDIAGVCDASGLVLGLMPHPERYASALNHPAWTRAAGAGAAAGAAAGGKSDHFGGDDAGAGLKLFINAVRHVEQAVGHGV
ncbi:MAG TPA: phosphoribosylformylglycinamidine synthase I [Tepidisphaeraceae bacterium]|nr:phosphoribosylformylglycinamidine synthase I [Tepidisphaeraceae bacterium]